jgi:hypothetical protein
MFCGFMVGHRVHLPMIQTAGFLPWGLWGIERLRRRAAGGFFVLVPVFFLALAAGHWAILSFMALAWGAYLLLRGRPLAKAVVLTAGAALLAGAMAAPQIEATLALLAQATRRHIGYATVGENSFFPAAAVLALFPMLMGNTTPNFFPQKWWGVWHLWEMLGYVGLITLVLAGSAVWALYRKKTSEDDDLTPIVRTWTWIGIGAGVWMLGYYLPTYWLVHKIPLLGVVRCPARMLLVVDLALAALAAVAVHGVMQGKSPSPRRPRLGRCVRVIAARVLPLAMVATLVMVAAVAWWVRRWPRPIPLPFAGGAEDALAAIWVGSPAIWVPLALALAAIISVRLWLADPARAWPILLALLMVDLFFLAHFLDVPADSRDRPDPTKSPAAAWFAAHGANDPYIVFGLNRNYRDRPGELLQPKIGQALGIATLGSYGPWHSPAHAHLFGFDTYGRCREWAWLVRRNHLLSLYNVRYLVAAGREFRDVIESVRITPALSQGPNLLTGLWEMSHALRLPDDALRLQTPFLWRLSQAQQEVALEVGGIYRIALDARGAEEGGGNFLRAEVLLKKLKNLKDLQDLPGGQCLQTDALGLTVIEERIGPAWRHFEWTFAWPAEQAGRTIFRVYTMSERPIEVRNVALQPAGWETPMDLFGRLDQGQAVYRKVAEVEPLAAGGESVAIYENLLCPPAGSVPPRVPADERSVERLRWLTNDDLGAEAGSLAVPDVGLAAGGDPSGLLWRSTVPAAALLGLVGAVAIVLHRRSAGKGGLRTL